MSGLEKILNTSTNFINKVSKRTKYFLFGSFLLGFLGLVYDNAKAQSALNAIISGNVKEVVSDSALADILVYLKDLNDNIVCIDTTDVNGDYSLDCSLTGIEEDKPDKTGFNFMNRGNIFSNTTGFLVSVEEPIELDLKIYDLLGREVGSLAEDRVLSAGNNYSFTWNPNYISSGIYFYRANINNLNTNNEDTRTGKLTYFKNAGNNILLNVVNPEKFDSRTNISSSSLANYIFTVTDSLTDFYNYIEQITLVDGDNLTKDIEMIVMDDDTLNNVTFLQVFKGLTATVDTVPFPYTTVAEAWWRPVDIPIPTNLDSVNAPDSFDIYADSGLTSWENLTGRDWFNVIYCCSLPDSFGIDVYWDSLAPFGGFWGTDKGGWEGSCGYTIHGDITIDTTILSLLGVQGVTAHEAGHGLGFYHPDEWVNNPFIGYVMRRGGSGFLYPHPFEGKALQILYGFEYRCTDMGPYRDDWTAWIISTIKEKDYFVTNSSNGCKVNYIYKEEPD